MDRFERSRPRLEAIAYRLLGSSHEAEDIVQETFLRWQAAHVDGRWTADVATTISLRGSGVRLATVANFPHGSDDIARAAEECAAAAAAGPGTSWPWSPPAAQPGCVGGCSPRAGAPLATAIAAGRSPCTR